MQKYDVMQALKWGVPLESERLLLRRLRVEDYVSMYDYARREDVTRYLLWSPHPSPDYTKRYLRSVQRQYRIGDFYEWGVEEKESHRLVGTCGFVSFDFAHARAEVGYVFSPAVWGRGYASEALRETLRFGFDALGLHRIEARFMAGNTASRRVMEKCGMHYEGMAKGLMLVKGEWKDIGICAIVK